MENQSKRSELAEVEQYLADMTWAQYHNLSDTEREQIYDDIANLKQAVSEEDADFNNWLWQTDK